MNILANRNSVQGLLTYYISMYGFVFSCIAISQNRDGWEIAGFVLTLCAMVIQDVNWIRRSRVHPHDMWLIEKLTEKLQEKKTDLFLKEHDFVQYVYDDNNLEALEDILYLWKGVDNEFVSGRYQRLWLGWRNKLGELMVVLRDKAAVRGGNFYHMLPPAEAREKDPELGKKMEMAKTANALAREVYEGYQGFRRIYMENKRVVKGE